MIDPKDFISSKQVVSEDIEEIFGTFACPENGCYEVSQEGLLNVDTRVVTWMCSNGHPGKASL